MTVHTDMIYAFNMICLRNASSYKAERHYQIT
jgi:hypothetical protein